MSPIAEQSRIPLHVGIIMDGNGRWAKKRGLPCAMGHKAGVKAFERIVKHAKTTGVRYLTVYALSTENKKRSAEELAYIKGLFCEYIRNTDKYRREDARLHFLGDISWIGDPATLRLIDEIEREYEEREGCFTLNIAFHYGGRDEILRACRRLMQDCKSGVAPDELDEEAFSRYLYTAGQPDVDLIIRTSGEQRLSNFLIWQTSYAEYTFPDILWPDFSPADFDAALREYAARERRMGGRTNET